MERDIHSVSLLSALFHFNSHAHVERDPFALRAWAWGGNFNSHAHVERDTLLGLLDVYQGHFNSHAHVERDAFVSLNLAAEADFNSHAHVERDFRTYSCTLSKYISTHTLTWSVTF